jgi:hypothetical protein
LLLFGAKAQFARNDYAGADSRLADFGNPAGHRSGRMPDQIGQDIRVQQKTDFGHIRVDAFARK